jgi:hypothetical protein
MFMPLPDPIIEVLTVFRPLFTAPTWRKLMTLLTGTLLAQGRRTVAAALRASGNAQATNWSCFHQVLNRARWSPLAVSRQLLLLIVETFVPAGASVDLVIDETLERRWGSKVSKRGHYRDSALFQSRAVSEQSWPALDRDGGRRDPSLDETEMGVAVLVCPRHDS